MVSGDDTSVSHFLDTYCCQEFWNASGLSIFTLNIRSLSNTKLTKLQLFLDNLVSRPKILIIVETWIQQGNEKYANLDGYAGYHSTRNRIGGGISIFISNSLTVKGFAPIIVNEVEFLRVSLLEHKIELFGFYRPPVDSNFSSFLSTLDGLLEGGSMKIFCGDANVDLFKPDNPVTIRYKSVLASNNFNVINNLDLNYGTRITRTSNTCIDHVFTNLSKKSFVLYGESGISDHKFLLAKFDLRASPEKSEFLTRKVVDFENVSLTLYNNYINFETFHKSLRESVLNNTTTIKINLNNRNYKKPWYDKKNNEFKKLRRKYYDLKEKYPNNLYFQEQYKTYNKIFFNNNAQSKKTFFENELKKSVCNPKMVWQLTRQLTTNNFSPKYNETIILRKDNILMHDEFQVANEFNSFFTGRGNVKHYDDVPFAGSTCPFEISEFSPTDPQEISKHILNLKDKRSVGYDSIPISFIKSNIDYFSNLISNDINESFLNGVFPSCLKKSIVTAIFKKGDKFDPSNYRPISLLSAFSKVYESVIKCRLEKYLYENKIIDPRQFGFKKRSSTTSAGISLIDHLIFNINRKKKTAITFIDLKKAFSSLNYSCLKKILYRNGIRGKAADLILDYLRGRTQQVKIGQTLSEEMEVLQGVPEGSLLGPLLYLIYVNDLFKLSLHGRLQMYADDSALIYHADSFLELSIYMEHDLNLLSNFLSTRNLFINFDKTEFMLFITKNTNVQDAFHEIIVGNKKILRTETYNYLGLVLDSQLNWSSHIEHIAKKISPYTYVFFNLRRYLSSNLLETLYFAFIQSQLSYLLPIWGGAPNVYFSILSSLQNKILRIINFKPASFRNVESFYNDRILSLENLSIYDTVMLIRKIVCKIIFTDVLLCNNISVSQRNTRNGNLLRPPNYLMTLTQSSFIYRGINLYNRIPGVVFDGVSSFAMVKRNLKKFVSLNDLR